LNTKYYNISPETYDSQFWWKKDDVEFWKNIFYHKKQSILELAAGTGRLGIPLIREGHNYIGIEISTSYCLYANEVFQKLCNADRVKNDDMRFFNLGEKYDNIFIGFNSLLHLLTEKDLLSCLSAIKKHMHARSHFYIDILVPHPLFLYRPKDLALRVLEFKNENDAIIYIDEMLDYDKNTEIANITWIYSNTNKEVLFNFDFQMKMYFPDTIHRLLNENGFRIKNVWGDYNKNQFNEESTLQIYECYI